MDLLSEEAIPFTLPTTRHLMEIPIPTLAGFTAHQAGTTMETLSPRHFWQALISLLQTK